MMTALLKNSEKKFQINYTGLLHRYNKPVKKTGTRLIK